MSSKNKAKSPILKAVHETAADLHRLGFIDKRKMREFDAAQPEYRGPNVRRRKDSGHSRT